MSTGIFLPSKPVSDPCFLVRSLDIRSVFPPFFSGGLMLFVGSNGLDKPRASLPK
jgi:hypothetical protein